MNRESLLDVERSLVVLCLDGAAGVWSRDRDARFSLAAAQTIHGGGAASHGANRWFDKTVQVFFRLKVYVRKFIYVILF